MLSKRKRNLAVAVAVFSACSFFGYKYFFCKSDAIVLNGNVEIQDVNVSFRVSGKIKSISVEEGKFVKEGEVLAVIDSDIFSNVVSYSKAKVEEAQINLKNYQKDYERNVKLFKNKSISEKVFDDATVKYKVAKAEYDGAVAAYNLAIINYQDCVLKSPVDGTVLTRNIEVGEMIGNGIPAFSIMPDAKTKIKTFAAEDVLSKIKHDDTVYVHTETNKAKKFKGHIGFISSEAEFTPKNIETSELRTSLMYRIRVIVDEPAPELKQGMPVTVTYEQ